MIRPIVCCYSRTGNTFAAAEAIAGTLGVEVDKIEEMKNRKGVLGAFSAGFDAATNRGSVLVSSPSVEDANLIIIGSPIWCGRIATPVVRWLESVNLKNKKVIAFLTYGGGPGKAPEAIKKLIENSGADLLATFSISTGKIGKEELHNQARENILGLNDLIKKRFDSI